jgi:beta-galactosidase/beta-glucuronidase
MTVDFWRTRKIGVIFRQRLPGLLLGAMVLFGCGSGGHDDLLIPDSGWHLWVDREASWENDELFLPDEVDLALLPVTPPTGGWEVLDSSIGTQVTLPTTVEEHYWGKFGYRPYKNAYYFERLDDGVKNGNVLGVSWWWQEVAVPERARGKKVLLHIRGARLRAEVFMNQKLVGYHLIGQTGFVCDVSEAVKPGEKNRLAIRITNPGGRLAWLDIALGSWGSYKFYTGRGFGGLDRGLRLTIHDPVYLEDCWVLNTPEYRTVDAHALIVNDKQDPVTGSLQLRVIDPSRGGKVCHTQETEFQLEGSARKRLTESLSLEDAELWSIETPRLYRLVATVSCRGSDGKPMWEDSREVPFGFRWFEADGIGSNAVFRLNGKRTRLVSAISWGFWGRNGLWPSPELAEREVKAAKKLGLNCIQFHRNLGKTDVLDVQDRMGLMRSMEPGGGITALGRRFPLGASSPTEELDTSGTGGDPETFAEKFMEEKIVRMIRDHRSHPSLVLYIVQNEMAPDLRNPRIFRILRRMHEEDPSRLLVLKSGPFIMIAVMDIPAIGTNIPWVAPGYGRIICTRIRVSSPTGRKTMRRW